MKWILISKIILLFQFLNGPIDFPFVNLLVMEDRVTVESYQKIKLKMSLKHVRNIVGSNGSDFADPYMCPGLERRIADIREQGHWHPKTGDNLPGRRWNWCGWDAVIAIRLGKDGKVTDKMIITLQPLDPIDRLRQIITPRLPYRIYGR